MTSKEKDKTQQEVFMDRLFSEIRTLLFKEQATGEARYRENRILLQPLSEDNPHNETVRIANLLLQFEKTKVLGV